MNSDTLGIRLQKLRGDVPRTRFAGLLGIDQSLFRKYERDESVPGGAFLARLHEQTRVNLNWLLAGEGQMILESDETLSSSDTSRLPPLDGILLARTLRLVEDWLTDNNCSMTPERKAVVVTEIYAFAVEDAAEGRDFEPHKIGRILKLVVG